MGKKHNNVQYTELPSEGFDKCVICGANTTGYAFCRKCFKKHEEAELLDILNKTAQPSPQAENTYEENNTAQDTTPLTQSDDTNDTVIINPNNKSKCITCGRQTDGLLFCSSCYHKYKDKELMFRITNCSNIELVSDTYGGNKTCKDGHIVKSKSEREIDNYLFDHGIPHAYERTLSYGKTDKEILHPDFYLPNYLGEGKHVYIEHWGYNKNNIKYTETKKFKIPIYKELGITLICTYEETDMNDIESALDRKLNKDFITIGKINYDNDDTEKNSTF